MAKDVQDRQTLRPGFRTRASKVSAMVALSFLLSAGVLLGSTLGSISGSSPAFANWDGGAEHSDDWNADHDGIYQVQRGDLICESREACGGAAAVPMNRPGYWYLPGGMLPAYHPVPAALPKRR